MFKEAYHKLQEKYVLVRASRKFSYWVAPLKCVGSAECRSRLRKKDQGNSCTKRSFQVCPPICSQPPFTIMPLNGMKIFLVQWFLVFSC